MASCMCAYTHTYLGAQRSSEQRRAQRHGQFEAIGEGGEGAGWGGVPAFEEHVRDVGGGGCAGGGASLVNAPGITEDWRR